MGDGRHGHLQSYEKATKDVRACGDNNHAAPAFAGGAPTLSTMMLAGGNRAMVQLRADEDREAVVDGLPLAERLRLEMETGDRIGVAFTKYVDACNDHIAALKAAAGQSQSILLVIVDVAFALVAPGASKGLGKLLDMLPPKSSERLYRSAILLMNNAPSIVAATLTGGKRAAGMAFQSALRKTDDEAFLDDLKQGFSEAVQAVRGGLKSRSDEEVAVVWAAHDAAVATKAYYSSHIGQLLTAFKQEVEPIGKSDVLQAPQPQLALSELIGTGGLVAVELGDGPPVLVRIRLDAYRNGGGSPVLKALGYVSAEMRQAAIARALRVQPRGIQTVPRAMVQGLSGSPPPDAARLGGRE